VQARAYFQWANYASSQKWRERFQDKECLSGPSKPSLYINMDETSLAYAFPQQRGTVVVTTYLPRGRKLRGQSTSVQDQRGHVTYMCFVANDSLAQARLPQILIGNEHFFTVSGLQKLCLSGKVPANIHLWRMKSAWNSHEKMRRALCILRNCLGQYMETHNVVLVLDVHGSHVHRSISLLARRLGIELVYVLALGGAKQ
jgi:hypothetical protein